MIGGLAAAIFMCGGLIGYGLLESANYERQSHDKSNHYARETSEKVAQTCIRLTPVERIDCLYKATDAQREYEYNQADLVAQRQSALWAYIMAGAAVIGMLLSVVGVILVWTTFRETKKAASISEKTYQAFIAFERPRLVVGISAIQNDGRGQLSFDVSVTNIGKNSCVVTNGLWEERATASADEIKAYVNNMPIQLHVNAGATERVSRLYCGRNLLKTKRFFGGVIVYQSALQAKHRSYFLYELIEETPEPFSRIHRRDMKGADWPEDD